MEMRLKSIAYSNASQKVINSNENLHCALAFAYYSLFMYMKHLLANKKRDAMTYAELEFSGANAHTSIVECMRKDLPANKDTSTILNRILELHSLRVEAEYTAADYSQDYVLQIHEECEQIKKRLKYYFVKLLTDEMK